MDKNDDEKTKKYIKMCSRGRECKTKIIEKKTFIKFMRKMK